MVLYKESEKDYSKVAPLKQDNTTLTQPQAKAEILNTIFSSIFITEDTSSSVATRQKPLSKHTYT